MTRKKSPNVYQSCPKMISQEKLKILTLLQKLPKNVGDLGKLSVAKGFKTCPKSNKSPNLVTLGRSRHSSLNPSAPTIVRPILGSMPIPKHNIYAHSI